MFCIFCYELQVCSVKLSSVQFNFLSLVEGPIGCTV